MVGTDTERKHNWKDYRDKKRRGEDFRNSIESQRERDAARATRKALKQMKKQTANDNRKAPKQKVKSYLEKKAANDNG